MMIAMKSYFYSYLLIFSLLVPTMNFALEKGAKPHGVPVLFANSEIQDFSSQQTLHQDEQSFPETQDEPIVKESETFQTKFFNMIFLLGLLIAFMLLASWALKRMMKSKLTQINEASHIKVIESRYLSPRATLYIVEAENQTFLIAESPTTVSYLTKLNSLDDK